MTINDALANVPDKISRFAQQISLGKQ